MPLDDAGGNAVLDGLFCIHPKVPFDIGGDSLEGLTGFTRDDPRHAFACSKNLASLNRNVRCAATRPAAGLMDHEPGVGQADASILWSSKENVGTGAGDPSGADCGDRRSDKSN